MMPPSRVGATYRLQFHGGFTFAGATALVDYLAALGVSHVYASPILKARRGSLHGYDIVDHETINPELGGDSGFAALSEALAARGMGIVLDIVPNHMGVGADNAWWLDVLEWGETSPYAAYFDIDWEPLRHDFRGKVLLPLLGEQYGTVLEQGEFSLAYDLERGEFVVAYYEHRIPVSPRSYAALLRRAKDAGADGAIADLAQAFAGLGRGRSRRARQSAHEEGTRLKHELADLARADTSVRAALDETARALSGDPGNAKSWRRLHALLERQSYRLAYWRTAADEINYRRFFTINDLAGIRVELPALFTHVHRRVLALVADGKVQGLRVDHIDGLFDPARYCEELQREAARAARVPEGAFYIVVEKILAPHETLRHWPVAGTTGYEFIAQVGGIFADPAGEAPLSEIYQRFTGRDVPFDEVVYRSKKRITAVNLASEMNVLSRAFHALAAAHWRTRDFTLNAMRAALDEVIAHFPVYRTYVAPDAITSDDRRYIEWAVGQAKRRWPGVDTSILDFIAGVLMGDVAKRDHGYGRGAVLRLAMKFQQLSGPVMAKGLEDTAFYRYARLLSLNDVGGDPRRFCLGVASFHRLNEARAKTQPMAMLAASTHDTKRGEDARARLMVLSEYPALWDEHVRRWDQINRLRRVEIDGEPAPDREHEYAFYQTVVAAWPPDLAPGDSAGMADFAKRVGATILKIVREGKERSSWSNADSEYEAVLQRFVEGVLDASRPNPFLADMHAFVETLARPGAVNGLAQTLLRLTAPGVPDIYQGAELWNFDMVDPDNRRPVDFTLRRRLLDELEARAKGRAMDRQAFAELAAHWRDGREKLFLVWRALKLRAGHLQLFSEGAYLPLETSGRHADRLCAFARVHDGHAALTVVPRLLAGLAENGKGIDWADTAVELPAAEAWHDALAARDIDPGGARIAASLLFQDFPVALWLGSRGD